MYDNFKPFKELRAFEFTFNPRNFEIHFNGQLQEKGSTELIIGSKVNDSNDIDKISVIIGDILNSLNSQIKTFITFDKIVTSSDRIVLIKIPEYSSNKQIGVLASMFDTTRKSYDFEENEAYTCSIFTQNGNIAKLSFNLFNNRMIELY